MENSSAQTVTSTIGSNQKGKKKRFIITPGLHSKVEQFEAHYKTAPQEPIMIVGDTGVGKSLFLLIAKILFRREHQEKDPKKRPYPIKEANCAHFGGPNSDPYIARIELFGAEAGVAANVRDKVGLLERANNGLLILEEIGELPLEVQAMLLTFIDTGKYVNFGGEEIKNAKVQIIGATNNEEALRPDFRHRFFPFYVPPLYFRRGDVLYYLQHMFPEIIETLAPWEVMALLAHNWPGNVREVQRLGWLLRRNRKMREATDLELPEKFSSLHHTSDHDWLRFLVGLDRQVTSLDPMIVLKFYNFLKENNVKAELLEKTLNQYGIGFSLTSSAKAFKDFPKEGLGYEQDPHRKLTGNLKIPEIPSYHPFGKASFGLQGVLCPLIYQNDKANDNLLDIWNGPSKMSLGRFSENMILSSLAKSCFEALSGITLSQGDHFPDSGREQEKYFKALAKSYPDNEFLASLGFTPRLKKGEKTEEVKIEEMTEKQMLKVYYEKLLRTTEGNITKAARIAGVARTTFLDRVRKKAGISLKDAGRRFSRRPPE